MTSITSTSIFASAENAERQPHYWVALFQIVYGATYAAQLGHWHSIDPRFNDLHTFFGDEYDVWTKYVDTVAEHVRQHPGNVLLPSSLTKLGTGLREIEPTSDPVQLLDNYRTFVSAIDTLLVKADDTLEHPADVDLIGELARVAAKSIWKIDAISGSKRG